MVSYRLLTLTGEWSLGHVVIMGVGGTASALYTKALGVPVPLAMLAGATTAAALAFVIASFFAGLSGALLAHYIGTVNPNRFDVGEMVFVLIWAIVGGTATIYGPILGVVVFTIINEVVLRQLGFDQLRPLFYGAILIASILFLPQGLESLVAKARNAWAGRGGAG